MIAGVNVGVEGYEVSLKEDSPEGQDEIPGFPLNSTLVYAAMTLELQ